MSAAAPTIRDSNPRQDEPKRVAGRSPRQLIWARFREDRAALVGLAVLVLLALIAIFAGVISKYLAGHAPDELFQQTMTDEFGLPLGPNWEFFFGGDSVGRDLFVRVIYGARTSLLVDRSRPTFRQLIRARSVSPTGTPLQRIEGGFDDPASRALHAGLPHL